MSASPPPSGAEPRGTSPRTCYRHPRRETGVSCTRCERPICPDCMVEASVGFQCPACVAEGNRGLRRARTAFGGRSVDKPYVTWTILILMGVGYVGQMLTSENLLQAGGSRLVWNFGMLGYGIGSDGPMGVVAGEWYRLITSAFLHGGLWHLLFNGWAMYVLGSPLERSLGHGRFLALWLLGALSGSVLSLLLAPPNQFSIGASGAIFALFGAVFLVGRRLGADMRVIGIVLAINLVITFVFPQISWTAHIGGLAAGLLLGAVFTYLPSGSARPAVRTAVHTAAIALLAVVLTALVVAAPHLMLWALVP